MCTGCVPASMYNIFCILESRSSSFSFVSSFVWLFVMCLLVCHVFDCLSCVCLLCVWLFVMCLIVCRLFACLFVCLPICLLALLVCLRCLFVALFFVFLYSCLRVCMIQCTYLYLCACLLSLAGMSSIMKSFPRRHNCFVWVTLISVSMTFSIGLQSSLWQHVTDMNLTMTAELRARWNWECAVRCLHSSPCGSFCMRRSSNTCYLAVEKPSPVQLLGDFSDVDCFSKGKRLYCAWWFACYG